MSEVSISEFYDKVLANKEFQIPETGNLFFPAYIYTYDPKDEYTIRKEIEGLKERLIRPSNFIDTLILNIFDEFIEYLKGLPFGEEVFYDLLIQKEQDDEYPDAVVKLIKEKANDIEFFDFINEKATKHFKGESVNKRVYLFLYGFGSIFPFLRASNYLKNFEAHVKDYKLILFYPGKYDSNNYLLFEQFNDENIYRAVPVDSLLTD
jgi:hypothetical protein